MSLLTNQPDVDQKQVEKLFKGNGNCRFQIHCSGNFVGVKAADFIHEICAFNIQSLIAQ